MASPPPPDRRRRVAEADAPARDGRADVGAEVRRHHDDGVREVDRAPAPVGEAALVEDLQEGLEHVAVRLLDLVEQDHLIRALAHRLGELPAGSWPT